MSSASLRLLYRPISWLRLRRRVVVAGRLVLSVIPLSEAKARLSETADEVERTHQRVLVTRNGRDDRGDLTSTGETSGCSASVVTADAPEPAPSRSSSRRVHGVRWPGRYNRPPPVRSLYRPCATSPPASGVNLRRTGAAARKVVR